MLAENAHQDTIPSLTGNKASSGQYSGEEKKTIENNVRILADSRFLLSEKGSTLRMPSEFQQTWKEHKKLLRQIRKVKSISRKSSEDQFLRKVESLFCTELRSLPSVSELEESMDRLEKEYEEILASVKISGLQSTQNFNGVYASYDGLGVKAAVISKFQQLNEDAQALKESKYDY